MASHVLSNVLPTYPVGTSVSVYEQSDFPAGWSGGSLPANAGSATTSATVQSDGSLTFTGLVEGTGYRAYALVNSVPTYLNFTVKNDPGSSANPESVTGPLTDAQLAARLPLLVESARISKGYQQVTSTAAAVTLASLCSGAALPTGATRVEMIPSAPIRIRDDGNPSATVGIPVGTTGWDYDRDSLATLKVYGAATIDCWFYA